jgi:hypothetical protein
MDLLRLFFISRRPRSWKHDLVSHLLLSDPLNASRSTIIQRLKSRCIGLIVYVPFENTICSYTVGEAHIDVCSTDEAGCCVPEALASESDHEQYDCAECA